MGPLGFFSCGSPGRSGCRATAAGLSSPPVGRRCMAEGRVPWCGTQGHDSMRCTQADATGMLPSPASTRTPACGMVGGGSATAQPPQHSWRPWRHTGRCVYCPLWYSNMQRIISHAVYNQLQVAQPWPPIVCIILREGRQMTDRHIFALPRVAAYTSVRMLCAVAWTQYPSRPAPLVGPMTCTDPFRRLITTVSLRERRRSEICNVGGWESRSRWIPTQDTCRALEVGRVIPGVFHSGGSCGVGC